MEGPGGHSETTGLHISDKGGLRGVEGFQVCILPNLSCLENWQDRAKVEAGKVVRTSWNSQARERKEPSQQ